MKLSVSALNVVISLVSSTGATIYAYKANEVEQSFDVNALLEGTNELLPAIAKLGYNISHIEELVKATVAQATDAQPTDAQPTDAQPTDAATEAFKRQQEAANEFLKQASAASTLTETFASGPSSH